MWSTLHALSKTCSGLCGCLGLQPIISWRCNQTDQLQCSLVFCFWTRLWSGLLLAYIHTHQLGHPVSRGRVVAMITDEDRDFLAFLHMRRSRGQFLTTPAKSWFHCFRSSMPAVWDADGHHWIQIAHRTAAQKLTRPPHNSHLEQST